MTEKRRRLVKWPQYGLVLLVSLMIYKTFKFDFSSTTMTPFLQQATTTSTTTSPAPSKLQQRPRHAYAFLLAACDPADRRYQGFLYNIVMAVYSLQRIFRSRAEYVIMIQMAADSKYDTLLPEDVEPFSKLDPTTIHIKYLPKPPVDTYYQSMLSKFSLLQYTEFSRVLFLDADVLPLCNLDYVFDLSEQGILKENFIMASRGTPANGGFFMLRPGVDEYAQLQAVIDWQQQRALVNIQTRGRAFDYIEGWGHTIQKPDAWVTTRGKRSHFWNFYGSFADQGLLYHWVKYVKQNVSILLFNVLENWSPQHGRVPSNSMGNITTGTPRLEWSESTSQLAGFGCPGQVRSIFPIDTPPLYKDFWHYTGNRKPWELTDLPKELGPDEEPSTADEIWFQVLRRMNQELDLQWNITHMLPLGAAKLPRSHSMGHIIVTARANSIVTNNSNGAEEKSE